MRGLHQLARSGLVQALDFHMQVHVQCIAAGGRLADADAHLRASLRLDDRYATSWSNTGVIRLREGRGDEAEQAYAGLNHGEAVAVGMVLAARLSARLGMAEVVDADRLTALLARFGLPVAIPPGIDPDALLARMRLDKKATAGGLRFVLWRGPGQAEVVARVDESFILDVLRG